MNPVEAFEKFFFKVTFLGGRSVGVCEMFWVIFFLLIWRCCLTADTFNGKDVKS